MKYNYRKIRRLYPEYVNKEQFHTICHISKRTALYLLQNGLVPCNDNGNKTRRYKIATEDMITYLKKRERYPERYRVPSQYQHIVPMMFDVQPEELHHYYEMSFGGYPDVITAKQASEITGVDINTVARWIKTGQFRAFVRKGAYMIPKHLLIEYMITLKYRNKRNKSVKQIDDMGGFLKWQQEQSL